MISGILGKARLEYIEPTPDMEFGSETRPCKLQRRK